MKSIKKHSKEREERWSTNILIQLLIIFR